MRRAAIAALLLCAAGFATGKGGETTPQPQHGIVTPDVAAFAYTFGLFKPTPQGYVVCFEQDYALAGRCDNWRTIQQATPTGRTYVGFRLVRAGQSGVFTLELYFK